MNTLSMPMRRPLALPQSVMRSFQAEPRFAGMALLLLLAMVPTLFAMLVDPRLFNGINVWDKPLKFELALAVYLATLAWFSVYLPRNLIESNRYRLYSWVVVTAIALEIVWVSGSAANGAASHFNVEGIMGAIYALMGVLAVTLTSASLVQGVVFWRDSKSGLNPQVRLSLALGLVLTFVLTIIVAGYMSSSQGHWVGGNNSDVESFPLTGWARDGGDLRVAHFFATHALHFIPLVGLVASRTLKPAGAAASVWGASLAYCAFVGFAFVQALSGRPFAAF